MVPWLLLILAVSLSVVLLVQTYGRQSYSQAIPEKVLAQLGRGTTEGFSGAASDVKDFFTWLIHWRELAEENQQYKQQLAQLKAENEQLSQVAQENDELAALLDYKQNTLKFDSIFAKVIAAEPGSWINEFTVNRGSEDGIAVDMIVVNENGLVGRVIEVGTDQLRQGDHGGGPAKFGERHYGTLSG